MSLRLRSFVWFCIALLLLVFTFPVSFENHAFAKTNFTYGQHFPNGNAAVDYIYGPDGTWKPLTDVQYKWNYYAQYATPAHPYDINSLSHYANGSHQATARDANGHLLLDFNHDGELDATSGGSAFEEHSGKGIHNRTQTTPFSLFWFDDNWLARYMAQAYNRPQPNGLSQYNDFTRWQIIGGDTTHWTPYNRWFFDTLALDGLYYLATGNVTSAYERWAIMRDLSGAYYEKYSQEYVYPFIQEEYHLGLFKILTDKLIDDDSLSAFLKNDLIQHSISLRSHILSNQERNGSTLYGWVTSIGGNGSLINTETIAADVLALGAGAAYTYEAGLPPLAMNNNGYQLQTFNVLSAKKSQAKPGYMTYGPYQNYMAGSYTVDFFLRSPHVSWTTWDVANLDVYDATTGQVLAQHHVSGFDMPGNDQWARISVPVHVTNPNDRLEFRTWWYGNADLDIADIQVR